MILTPFSVKGSRGYANVSYMGGVNRGFFCLCGDGRLALPGGANLRSGLTQLNFLVIPSLTRSEESAFILFAWKQQIPHGLKPV